jgi:hypothetical protein
MASCLYACQIPEKKRAGRIRTKCLGKKGKHPLPLPIEIGKTQRGRPSVVLLFIYNLPSLRYQIYEAKIPEKVFLEKIKLRLKKRSLILPNKTTGCKGNTSDE